MEHTESSKEYKRAEVENKWRTFWETEKVFSFSSTSDAPLYVVDTPPPYVSADHLHAGHMMSYAQAEFIVRYKRMCGFNVFYPMGFDDNGLPTERFVEKKYDIDKSKITKSAFIELCLKETEKGAQTYRTFWNLLGISVDWTKIYSTISPLARKISQWSLIDLYKKGALYRSLSPVLWCPSCHTAIAQADWEDTEEESKINYVHFTCQEEKITIATTRPELLPACVALYVHPEDVRYKHLIGKNATVPLFSYEVPIRTSEKVERVFGTGLMMVCTWGDKEDLEKWHMDKLNTRVLINEEGRLNALGGKYQGLKTQQARTQIIADLREQGYLVKQEDTTHTIHTHERCGFPTEFIMSKQWFIKIVDHKDTWLEQGQKIHWHPESKKQDYITWVNAIKWDWCISRQRYYGVPLPIWYCEKCEEPVFATEAMLPVNPLESDPPLSACPACGHTKYIPEHDVMDTWATSSCTPFIIKELVDDERIKEKIFPATVRPNAFEIIRTWDFYSLVKSYYHFNQIPFQHLMVSGHGLDERGKKISKRNANYIPSEKLIEEYGADAIRYWTTGATLGQNLRFNIAEIKKGKKTAIKLWNVGRLIMMQESTVTINDPITNQELVDVWIIQEYNKTIKKVTDAFEYYTYAEAKDGIDQLFWTFTDYYVECTKYRLMGDTLSSKQAAQHTLLTVFLTILKMYAPILPFITEELYQLMYYQKGEDKKSIHLSAWPSVIKIDTHLDVSDFDQVKNAIDEIRKYKSEKQLPLGSELAHYQLQNKIDMEKYGDIIKKVGRVHTLTL